MEGLPPAGVPSGSQNDTPDTIIEGRKFRGFRRAKTPRHQFPLSGYPKATRDSPTHRQQQLAQILCLPEEGSVIIGYKRTSPKIGPLLTFLERELQRHVQDYRPVLEYCGFSVIDDAEPSVVDLIERVMATIVAENMDREISMDKIVKLLRTQNGLPIPREKPTWDVRQGMFRLLGRITMLYEIPDPPSHLHLNLQKPLDPRVLFPKKPINEAGAPLGQLMAGFGEFVPAMKRITPFKRETWLPKQPEPCYLDINILNFSTLTRVAKINVVWSNLMSEHLSELDFPFYWRRLEAIQQYTKTVKARNLKEVWYDERDPEKWAVLWLAIMIGGAAIILSFVQVILAAFQVAFAVPRR
ncbi:MAG: hypothetical protein Q9186_001135 [Xanthomendoza sp. 1 TL-2023]